MDGKHRQLRGARMSAKIFLEGGGARVCQGLCSGARHRQAVRERAWHGGGGPRTTGTHQDAELHTTAAVSPAVTYTSIKLPPIQRKYKSFLCNSELFPLLHKPSHSTRRIPGATHIKGHEHEIFLSRSIPTDSVHHFSSRFPSAQNFLSSPL